MPVEVMGLLLGHMSTDELGTIVVTDVSRSCAGARALQVDTQTSLTDSSPSLLLCHLADSLAAGVPAAGGGHGDDGADGQAGGRQLHDCAGRGAGEGASPGLTPQETAPAERAPPRCVSMSFAASASRDACHRCSFGNALPYPALPVQTRGGNFMGWYHSHPFDVGPHSNAFLSATDVGTQLSWQMQEDFAGNPWLALVVDPLRGVAKGKPEIGAFRCYPPTYSPPKGLAPDGATWADERARNARWGESCVSYYCMVRGSALAATGRQFANRCCTPTCILVRPADTLRPCSVPSLRLTCPLPDLPSA